jgi:hypothetical protein
MGDAKRRPPPVIRATVAVSNATLSAWGGFERLP